MNLFRPTKTKIEVQGNLLGRGIQTHVDHPMAQQFLSEPDHPVIEELNQNFLTSKLDASLMADFARRYSADVATLCFMHRIYQEERNRIAQNRYWNYFQRLKAGDRIDEQERLKKYFIAFIPGWGYRDDTTTGADFARQRALLNQAEIPNTLIETGEYDLVDHNAHILAEQFYKLNQIHERIIVVSASKGGLETSLAFGKLLDSHLPSIKSWISVGGILRGSPLADFYLQGYRKWMAKTYFWFKGQNLDIIRDMSYQRRSVEYKTLTYPSNLSIYHLVGAPWATNIHKEIKSRYHMMLPGFGPNDGLTPIVDELTDKGIVLTEPGLNHYFRDPHIDLKTMALALLAISE